MFLIMESLGYLLSRDWLLVYWFIIFLLIDEKILDEASDWLVAKRNVVLATVIQTWGSSPRPIGSRMIINDKGDFSGSVSGGCVETAVVRECMVLIKENNPFKKIEFKVSNESAWEVGLACGGEIAIFLEQIN